MTLRVGLDGEPLQRVLEAGCPSTGSDLAVSWASARIAECAGHAPCKISDDACLPDRVLAISLSPSREGADAILAVRLHKSVNVKKSYATLSHMWGGHQPLRLLKGNIADFRNGINWSSLPKTFQQAIKFTKQLGIDYIWIDSLCIIQDSAEDWRSQSSKMASIYENSHITLAASVAENSLAGCFRNPDPFLKGCVTNGRERAYTHDASDLQNLLQKDAKGPLVFMRGDVKHRTPSRLEATALPLLQRGWVYQERLLSPRVLFFGEVDLMWECNQRMSCYCKSWTHSYSRNVRSHPVKQQHAASFSLGLDRAKPLNPASLSGRWVRNVEEYSALQLTFMKDQLPAIAGIAKQFSRYMGDNTYASGMWTAFLIELMAWAVHRNALRRDQSEPKTTARPSWSWIAPRAQVFFPQGWFVSQSPTCPTVVATNFEQNGIDPFMDVTNGSITLNGLLLEAVVREVTTSSDYLPVKYGVSIVGRQGFSQSLHLDHGAESHDWQPIMPQWLRDQGERNALDTATRSYMQLRADEDLDDEDSASKNFYDPVLKMRQIPGRFWCFALGRYIDDGGRLDVYLLLELVDEAKQIYRRIGFGSQGVEGSIFEGMSEKQTITLI